MRFENLHTLLPLLFFPGPPGEPVGVYVQTKTAPIIDPAVNPNTTRIIMWTDGLDHGSIITNYFIEFRTDFDLRWRVHSDGNSKLS